MNKLTVISALSFTCLTLSHAQTFTAGKDFNGDGIPFSSYSSTGQDFYQWTDTVAGSGLVTAFARNISNSSDTPNGWLRLSATKAYYTSSGAMVSNKMYVECFKDTDGALPFPKIKIYVNKPISQLTTLRSYVTVQVPAIDSASWPNGTAPNDSKKRFNAAYDIYLSHPTKQKQANYCAVMIWQTWSGNWGPGGRDLVGNWNTVLVDGVEYYVTGSTNYNGCDYTINYCRKNRTSNPYGFSILNILNHAKYAGYLKNEGFDIAGAGIKDLNFGFEIFRANGTGNQNFNMTNFTLTCK